MPIPDVFFTKFEYSHLPCYLIGTPMPKSKQPLNCSNMLLVHVRIVSKGVVICDKLSQFFSQIFIDFTTDFIDSFRRKNADQGIAIPITLISTNTFSSPYSCKVFV